jgi:NAD+-dependent protein deacetylase sirtuin 4
VEAHLLRADAHTLGRVLQGAKVALLTGAGVSTDSGIPDYRSPGRPPRNPIQHKQFVDSEAWRRRYWARSMVGWPRFSLARPSAVHRDIAALESRVTLTQLITQNVDRLHHAAGSTKVIELHGALAEVKCLSCGELEDRQALQARLLTANPEQRSTLDEEDERDFETRPDGDVELSGTAIERFVVVPCERCGGVLMPNVVFFGGTVPKSIVEASYAAVDAADALLVLGTSLTVFSGYRFVKRAHDAQKPVLIVNRGPTRGDPLATHKVDASLAALLPLLLEDLS